MYFKNNIGLCTNLNDSPDDGKVEVPKCVMGKSFNKGINDITCFGVFVGVSKS
jgi:hypothetical protein